MTSSMLACAARVAFAAGLAALTAQAPAAPKGGGGSGSSVGPLSWDKSLPSAERFTVLNAFGDLAVRDNNTGLVWERAPDGATFRSWEAAVDNCLNRGVGGTVGWRLPTVVELNSVRDTSLPPPFVPDVFSGVQLNTYWTSTTMVSDPGGAWDVRFHNGLVSRSSKGSNYLVWCVRGPTGAPDY